MNDVKLTADLSDIDLSKEIAQIGEDMFAEDIKILDVKGLSSVVDYLVIMTAQSHTQVKAISANVSKKVKGARERLSMEGRVPDADWILLDYGSIVVHVFDSTARLYYNLDELWQGDVVFWEPR